MQQNTLELRSINIKSNQLTSDLNENIKQNIIDELSDRSKINIYTDGIVSPDTVEIINIQTIEYRNSSLYGDLFADVQVRRFSNVVPIGAVIAFTVTDITSHCVECVDHYFKVRVPFDIQNDKTFDIHEFLRLTLGKEERFPEYKLINLKDVNIGDTLNVLIINTSVDKNNNIIAAIGVAVGKNSNKIQRIYHEQKEFEITEIPKEFNEEIIANCFPNYLGSSITPSGDIPKEFSKFFKAYNYTLMESCYSVVFEDYSKVKKYYTYITSDFDSERIRELVKDFMVVVNTGKYLICSVKI